MKTTEISKTLRAIISVRKMLIKRKLSGKNTARCHSIMKSLSLYMDAYGSRWDETGWRRFIRQNQEDIIYLIPENKSGETLKQKIYEYA